MVKTVTALPLSQGASGNAAVQGLEPGTELKARVEANLPGGVVRLAAADTRYDLRVPAPLPVGAEVTVTVSGSKQQPAIQITTSGGAEQARPSSAQLPQTQPGSPPGGASGAPSGQLQAGSGSPLPRSDPALVQLVQSFGGSSQAAGGAAGLPLTAQAQVAVAGQQAVGAPQGHSSPAIPPQAPATPVQQGPAVASSGANVPPPAAAPGGLSQPVLAGGPSVVPPAPGGAAQPGAPAGNAAAVPGSVLPAGGQATAVGQPGFSVSQPPTPQPPIPQSLGSQASTSQAPVPPVAAPQTRVSAAPASVSGGSGQAIASQALSSSAPPGQAVPGSGTAPLAPPNIQPPYLQAGASAQARPGLPGQPVSTAGAGPQSVSAPSSPVAGQGQPGAAELVGKPGASGRPISPVPSVAARPATANAPVQGGQRASASAPASAQMSGQQALPTEPGAAPLKNLAQQTGTAPGAKPGISPGGMARMELPFSRTVPAQPYPAAAGASPSAGGEAVPGSQSPVQQVAALLRQPLAEQQAGFGGLFAQLASLMSARTAGKVSLPDPVVKAMQQILGFRLNSAQPVTGKDVQHAIRSSGQFREAQAGRPGSGPLPDLKSALLSLKALLQQLGAEAQVTRPAGQPPAPSRHGAPQGQAQQAASGYSAGGTAQTLQSLLQETDSTLARMRLTQLVNSGLSGDDGPRAASRPMDIVLELPLALGQETAVMQMQVGRDGGGHDGEEEKEPAWRLRFALDLTATGPLEAAISLRGGGTYASLWIDRKETYDTLNAVRESMEAAFADAGLDLQELRLIRGLPPKSAARSGALIDRQS